MLKDSTTLGTLSLDLSDNEIGHSSFNPLFLFTLHPPNPYLSSVVSFVLIDSLVSPLLKNLSACLMMTCVLKEASKSLSRSRRNVKGSRATGVTAIHQFISSSIFKCITTWLWGGGGQFFPI